MRIRQLLSVLLATLALGGGLALAAPSSAPMPSAPVVEPPIDLVSPVEVRPFRGPAWWRISDGKGTLWILGVPDAMLNSVRWNDAGLKKRLAAADRLLLPELGSPPGFSGWALSTVPGGNQSAPMAAYWNRLVNFNSHAIDEIRVQEPLDQVLPTELMTRVRRQVDKVRVDRAAFLKLAQPYDVALWLDIWSWPKGLLGSPIVDRAQILASARHVPIQRIPVRALWKPALLDVTALSKGDPVQDFYTQSGLRVPPMTVQLSCLSRMLDQVESGQMPAIRQAGMAAWAKGDVDNALKRSGTAQLCLMGAATSQDAVSYWQGQTYLYDQVLDQAFGHEGEMVALVELDPLLMPDGILSRFRRLGYSIDVSDGF